MQTIQSHIDKLDILREYMNYWIEWKGFYVWMDLQVCRDEYYLNRGLPIPVPYKRYLPILSFDEYYVLEMRRRTMQKKHGWIKCKPGDANVKCTHPLVHKFWITGGLSALFDINEPITEFNMLLKSGTRIKISYAGEVFFAYEDLLKQANEFLDTIPVP